MVTQLEIRVQNGMTNGHKIENTKTQNKNHFSNNTFSRHFCADQETKDLWQLHGELEKKMQHLQGEMGAQAAIRGQVNLASPEASRLNGSWSASSSNKSHRGNWWVAGLLTKVLMKQKFRALSRSLTASSFCLPTLRDWVLQRRDSFCISAMTITLCHLLSRI